MASYLAKIVENESDKKASQLLESAHVRGNEIAHGCHLYGGLFVPKNCRCHLEDAEYHPDICNQVLIIS